MSGFSNNELLYPITKGDVAGHPFHGNQYQDGSGTSVPSGVHTINGENFTIAPRADLSGANLLTANLKGADLSGADLSNATLSVADLSGADLSGADLRYANLRGASLPLADLRGANLRGARLNRADLYGANLCGADLSNTDLSSANLSSTFGNENTKLPPTHEVVNGFIVKRK